MIPVACTINAGDRNNLRHYGDYRSQLACFKEDKKYYFGL
jgi:hypothetical protein